MNLGRSLSVTGGALAILGLVALGGPMAVAQDATPEAVTAAVPRPAHIHAGNCAELGEIVAPLVDLTGAQGEGQGQARRAIPAESSYTNVPLPLDAILAADHAINVHLSADEIETYIACGEIGGSISPEGALIVGLGEQSGSGFTGIAFLAPGADGASTDISVFIAQTQGGGGGRNRDRAADDTEAVGGAEATPEGITVGGDTDDSAGDADNSGTPEAGA